MTNFTHSETDQHTQKMWNPAKKRLLEINHFPHLRNLKTSNVESGYAFINRFISNSSGNLLSVLKSLCNEVYHQISHVHEDISKESIKKLTNIPCKFFYFPQPSTPYSNSRSNRKS
ncbi:uncharacterized protein VP01_3815g2 [Puccinia sorghi]|uniref:Uncharacterized protein n=1 Tax=Puccinia sorghi TaxID=27349 RepID=A0A0L6UV75_9BASI|nr:uncharacterized protein VP01_3815g2 [Puccinia sorghi]